MVGRVNLADESDAQLLRRFADERDECAFACLVTRHAKLVLGVCYRMLRNRQDTDDAFQAVMLTMATKSRSLTNTQSLSGWLYGVSVRTSLNLHRMNQRRRRATTKSQTREIVEMDDGESAELIGMLDEELAKLPDHYRDVLVMCDLESRTRQQVARQLSLPPGTIASRLRRGRMLLRLAMEQRGVTLAVGGTVGALACAARAAPAATPMLVEETVRSAMLLAAGNRLKLAASERIATLVNEVMRTMMIAKLKIVSCLCVLAVALVASSPVVMSAIGLSSGAANAGTIFFDDFDGNGATTVDGDPVTWEAVSRHYPFSSFSITDGNLRVAPTQPDQPSIIGVLDLELEDMSIRAQVRLEGEATEAAAVIARGDEIANRGFNLEIAADGVLWFGFGGAWQTVQTELSPTDEDVIIQLDAIGNTFSGWAWRAGEAMPHEPRISRVDNQITQGGPGVYYVPALQPQGTSGAAVYRCIHVADAKIVPEPTTTALCGIALLATLGIRRWPRLSRP